MTGTLYIQTSGEGPDLVMLHGWGMHAGVWQDVSATLTDQFRVHCVDLPGHGRSRKSDSEVTLAGWVDRVAGSVIPHLSGPACWLGWSLGGMVATQLAQQYPQWVKELILVATNLRFCQADDWPEAVAPEVLHGFATDLLQDHRATLQRFLALQVIGEAQSRQTLKALRQRLLEQAEPDTDMLEAGLAILQNTDLRSLAPQLTLPVLLIGGERDRLVSPAALHEIARLLPQCRLEVIPAAGHAPFVSRPELFVNLVKTYCETID